MYSRSGEGQNPSTKNSFKKGLGFFPTSLVRLVKDPIRELLNTTPSLPATDLDASRNGHSSGPAIPLIHLNQIVEARGEERQRLIQAFGIALAQVGFVALKVDQITPLLKQVDSETRRYFYQPLESKVLDWYGKEGFSFQGQDLSCQTRKADIKEVFVIPSNFSRWPRRLPSFSRLMRDYYLFLMRHSQEVMKYLLEYLGQPIGGMGDGMTTGTLRLVYYPTKKFNDPEAVWEAPHIDQNAITLMSPGTIPGLQLQTTQGHWFSVHVPEGFLIAAIGKQVEWKTAGLMKARRHRVINPGGPYTRLERFASQLSVSWDKRYSLHPFENCIEFATKGMTASKKAAYLKKYVD